MEAPYTSASQSLINRLIGPIESEFVLYVLCILLFADGYLAAALGANVLSAHTITAWPPAGQTLLTVIGYLVGVAFLAPWLRNLIQILRGMPVDRRSPELIRSELESRERSHVRRHDLRQFALENDHAVAMRHLEQVDADERATDRILLMHFVLALLLVANVLIGTFGSSTLSSLWLAHADGDWLYRLAVGLSVLAALPFLVVGLDYATREQTRLQWIKFDPKILGKTPPPLRGLAHATFFQRDNSDPRPIESD